MAKDCFVKDTPVLMASSSNAYNLKQIALGGLLAASAPIAAVPIQEVQLLDYAVAHTSINNHDVLGEAIAGTDEYIGTSKESRQNLDPYTSPQQRQRDEYQIDSLNWYAVTFSENMGASTAQLALHRDWIEERGYEENVIVELNLPEQGISGPFTITSIRHILPQKRPIDEDPTDDYGYRPVTALFTHVSSQVYDITFGDSTQLGVTYQHPIYSVTTGDWRLAGALQPGERVLTRGGDAEVVSVVLRDGVEVVYNLEVKDWHNFLVGDAGILVHNTCPWELIRDLVTNTTLKIKKINGKLEIPDNWVKHDILSQGKVKGSRYVHPDNNKIQIRVLTKGDFPHKPHNYDKPYGRYELGLDSNGKVKYADIDGNHVPFSDPDHYAKTHFLLEALEVE